MAGTIHVGGAERLDYEDWRHALAHASARAVEPDHRDLIRLARRVEKSLGRYQTRAERRRRRMRASADEDRCPTKRPAWRAVVDAGLTVNGCPPDLHIRSPPPVVDWVNKVRECRPTASKPPAGATLDSYSKRYNARFSCPDRPAHCPSNQSLIGIRAADTLRHFIHVTY